MWVLHSDDVICPLYILYSFVFSCLSLIFTYLFFSRNIFQSVYKIWLVSAAADVLVLSQSGRAQEESWIGLLNIALL